MRSLVFVHGRNQQGRDPTQLRTRWAAGLNKGLTGAQRPPLGPEGIAAIRFPFYGDVLYAHLVEGRRAVPSVATLTPLDWVDPGLPAEVNQAQVAVLAAMAREQGIDSADADPETMGWASAPTATAAAGPLAAVPGGPAFRGVLEWLANHSGVDEAVIRGFLRDVSAYLELPGCREAVHAVVRPDLVVGTAGPEPDVVVVGHSLGGAVSAELLADPQVRARVARFVAVGAPLGIDAVTDRMRPPGSARPESPWVNVYDPRDWVALGSPLPHAGGLTEQPRVANPRGYEHSIEHYLSHPSVAAVIDDALHGN